MGLLGRGHPRDERGAGLVRSEFPESTHPSAEEFYAGKGYAPLEAEDVASAVLYAVEQPERVCVDEILVRSTEQPKIAIKLTSLGCRTGQTVSQRSLRVF
jgi:hypothetical protein